MSGLLQQKIRTFLNQSGDTVASLERKAGLKPNTMRNILRGKSNRPSALTLQALAHAMECSVRDLLDAPHIAQQTLLTPSPASSALHIEHPEILTASLEMFLKLQSQLKKPLPLKQLFFLLEEAYTYGIKKSPPQVDVDFIKWIFEKTGST